MKRIELNLQTGELTETDFTSEEEAAAQAERNSPTTVLRAAETADAESVKSDATINYLRTHTPAECYTKVQNDVSNLAEAKQMMGRFAMALSILTRRL